MKKNCIITLVLLLFFSTMYAQMSFDEVFENKTLRVDFTLSGNNKTTQAYLYEVYEEPYWGGRKTHLGTSLKLGDFLLQVTDKETDVVIYEEGFATLFEEWQVTAEAKKMQRSYPNTVVMPFPKVACEIAIYRRDKGSFTNKLLSLDYVPEMPLVRKLTPLPYRVDTIKLNAPTDQALDIVILAEGFRAEEMEEFREVSKRIANGLLEAKVFRKNKKRINFYAVESVSEESGVDDPEKDQWKNTVFDASYFTFYSPRYLMARDLWRVRTVASLVPYDQIYIVINTTRYGGGGVYNYYSACSAYGRSGVEVLIHEFGHGFAALADEYFYDDEVYENYIDKTREPWQKNVTTLVDFSQKWGDLLSEGTPIPTPLEAQQKYPIGVYEGGAYVSKGVYRACPDCRMKTNEAKDFCPVCERAILQVLNFITGQ